MEQVCSRGPGLVKNKKKYKNSDIAGNVRLG